MGGDLGLEPAILGAVHAIDQKKDLEVHLFGQEEKVTPILNRLARENRNRILLRHCPDEITMEDHAGSAARTKKNSSMYQAIQSVADGSCKAVVSPGNSGAVMACSLFLLRRIEGVDRPAIMVKMPTSRGFCVMLDMGANVDCKANHLAQFALMGNAYAVAVEKIPKPRVAILSNGEEKHKGTEGVREASEIVKHLPLHYIGFVEGHDIFLDHADVIVCDGFVGNIVLKAAEGLGKSLLGFIKESCNKSLTAKLGALAMGNVWREIRMKMDPSEVGAAPLLGVNGNVFICHGTSNSRAIENALYKAYEAAKEDLLGKILRASREMMQIKVIAGGS